MAEKEPDTAGKRPFLLSVFCMALFVYTGTLAVIFLFALLFNGWITNAVNEFFPERDVARTTILILSLAGLLLNGLSFFALHAVWRLKRYGLYLFSSVSLAFILLPFMLGYGSLTSLGIIIVANGFVFLYYRRLK